MMRLYQQLRNMPKAVKASIAFFAANIVIKGIAYISTPLYTRLLSTDEYGQTSVFLAWFQVFGIIAMFCLSAGVFNNGMIDYPDKRDEYSFSMLILSNVITLCFSIILLSFYPLIKGIIKLTLPLVILMCVLFFFQPAYNFWVAKQRYEFKYKFTVLWSVLSALLSPTVAIFCILIFPEHKLYARIFGAEVALLVIYIGFYFYLAYKVKFLINTKYWKHALLFNLPLIPHYLSTYLLASSDRLMISYIVNDSATAYYSVAYSVASVITIVWSAANASLLPFTYEKCAERDYKTISKVTLPILAVFGVSCFLIILLAPEVVMIMATKDYTEAIKVIPPIVGGVFFQVHYYIFANILYYFKKPNFVMIGSITATLLNIVLNYIFIKKYGYTAAGYTTIFCYFIQAIIDYLAMRYVVKESVYNMKLITIMSAAIIIVSILGNLLYRFLYPRYIIVLLITVLGIIYHKTIIGMFTGIKKNEV